MVGGRSRGGRGGGGGGGGGVFLFVYKPETRPEHNSQQRHTTYKQKHKHLSTKRAEGRQIRASACFPLPHSAIDMILYVGSV